MQNKFRDKIAKVLKNPVFYFAIIIFFFFIVLLVATIMRTGPVEQEEVEMIYDPASGEYFENIPPTNGESGTIFVGMDNVMGSGVEPGQSILFTTLIEQYAEENNIDLERVSYLKDSLTIPVPFVFDFKIVLNVDQQIIHVIIDSSVNHNSIFDAKYYFYNEDEEEVFSYIVTPEKACEYYGCDLETYYLDAR